MSDVAIIELGPDSVELTPALGLLDHAHAANVRGPSMPTHSGEIRATWVTREARRAMAVAVAADGSVVGAASAQVLREGNAHLVGTELFVSPAYRRRGIGTQLWHGLLGLADRHEADTLVGYVGRPVEATEGWRLIDAAAVDPGLTVTVDLGDAPGTAFARAVGAAQGQAEIQSRLDLPVTATGILDGAAIAATLAPLVAQVADHAADYDISTYRGMPAEQYVDGLVALSGRMTIDPPFGEIDIRPDVRSRDRVEDIVRIYEAAGRLGLGAIAVQRSTGAVAALSDLTYRTDDPLWGDQGDTIVEAAHRGHRLGFAVKIAALQRFLADNPAARHIETYNAMENAPMFAVNRAMGFQPVGAFTIWQYKITD